MIACVLYNLDCCVKSYNFNDDSSSDLGLFPRWKEAKTVLTNHQIENSLKEILPFILSIYRESGRDFVILEDNITFSELEHSIRVIRNSAVNCLNSPVILTISMFKYVLAYYSPDLYASLRWKKEILLGEDSLYHLQEPSLDSFTRQLLAGQGNALCFAQGETFFTANDSNDDFMADLIRAITQLLKLRLYFDKGIIRVYKRQWYEELEKYFPDDIGTLAEIKERVNIHSMRDRLYCFEYLKHLADEVCRLFCAYATRAKRGSRRPSSASKR
jgi:hypothetical protein